MEQIREYKILKKVDIGGEFEQFEAVHTETQEKVWLFKILDHLVEDDYFTVAYIDEARIQSMHQHPRLLMTQEIIEEEGLLVFVYPYFEHDTDLLQEKGQLSESELLDIFASLAELIDWAQEHDIRFDLEPESVLIQKEPFDFRWRMLPSPGSSTNRVHSTQAGIIKGRLSYMSPEKVKGTKTGKASHYFTLGTMLYETVSGEKPFKGKSDLDTLRSILEKDPTQNLPENLSPQLSNVIGGLLEKKVKDRINDNQTLRSQLQEALSTPVPRLNLPKKEKKEKEAESSAAYSRIAQPSMSPPGSPPASPPARARRRSARSAQPIAEKQAKETVAKKAKKKQKKAKKGKKADLEQPLHIEEETIDQSFSPPVPPPPPAFSSAAPPAPISPWEVQEEPFPPQEAQESLTTTPDELGGSRADEPEKHVIKTLRRKGVVRHYEQMNPGKIFPLLVSVIEAELYIKIPDLPNVVQTESDQVMEIKESSPYVRIVPVIPGCIISPAEAVVDVREKKVDVEFWVAPQSEGDLERSARIQLWHEDLLKDEIPIPCRVTTHTLTKLASAGSVVSSMSGAFLEAYGNTHPDSEIAHGTGGMGAYLAQKFVALLTSSGMWIGLMFLVAAFLCYLWLRPKRGDVIEHFLHSELH